MRKKQAALEIPAYVRETLTALETAGHQAYCVGGCVRDSLLGRMPEDWDVTTSALPEGEALLRTSYMATHTEALLDEAMDIIGEVMSRE